MRGEDEQQSNGVPENLPTIRVVKDRSAYKDQHARIIIVARSKKLQPEAGYIYADCVSPNCSPCSHAADHTLA
jgi:hypothetical protein